jgi:hypothetical protein
MANMQEDEDEEGEFLVELIDEVVFFLNKLEAEDSQPMRRAFCRSVFQFVDGIASDLKQDVVKHESPELIGDSTYLALLDKKKVRSEGTERIVIARQGFAKNIRFAFDVYGWTAGVDIDLTEEPKDWERFNRCISIRNRVVHPRGLKDIQISKSEVIEMVKTFIWLKEALVKAHGEVGTSWLKMVEAMKSSYLPNKGG